MFRSVTFISFCLVITNSAFEYGEFDLKLTHYETCKAPKRKYCAEVKANIYDDVWLKFDVLVKENMTTIKTLFVGTMNNKEIIRLRVNNMCEHIFFKPVIQTIYNVTKGRCGIYKGHYVYSVDIQAISRSLYGEKFMYGNWTFKGLYFNDYCNVHCGNLKMTVTPRKTTETLL